MKSVETVKGLLYRGWESIAFGDHRKQDKKYRV